MRKRRQAVARIDSSDHVSIGRRPLSAGAVALMLICAELGFQPDRRKAGVAGRAADAAGAARSLGALPVCSSSAGGATSNSSCVTARCGPASPRASSSRRIRADLSRPAADLGVRAVVFLTRAVFRGARLLCVSRRAAARSQWGGWPELRRRGAGDRRAAGQCRRRCPARRSPDRRRGALWARPAAVKATALIRAPAKRASATRWRCRSRFSVSRHGLGRTIDPYARAAVAVAAGLPGVLGGRPDVPAVVHAGENLFASKLSSFTFITPLFGVVASYFIMHDT